MLKECASAAAAGFRVAAVIEATAADTDRALELGVTLVPLPPRRGSRFRRIALISITACRLALRTKARILHFHDPELWPCACLVRLMGRRSVIDLHEDLAAQVRSKHWIAESMRPLVSTTARTVQHLACRGVDAVVVATEAIGRGVPATCRCLIVRNFARGEELGPAASDRADVAARDSLCYVGGVSVERGLREVVEAAANSDTPLTIAGPFASPHDRERLEASPGWDRVRYLGFIGRERLRAELARSFAGIVTLYPTPNHLESLPIKLFEYMSAGLPVVASRLPVVADIVEGAACGILVDHDDVAGIEAAIRWLRTHPAEAWQMGRNGRQAVVDRFNWDGEAGRLIALYEELA